ncbi:hypothetical protein CRUP_003069 [Coryphaenoides rupestris]|nr:hypothetical protein CRUP_003069 [Coryphaenoides rupestris]
MAGLYAAPRMQALMAAAGPHHSAAAVLRPARQRQRRRLRLWALGLKAEALKRTLLGRPRKSLRNRWARSVPFELDGELYAVEPGGRLPPVAPGNRSRWSPGNGVRWNGAAPRDAEDEEEVEGFSGMGITATPTAHTRKCSISMNDTVKCDGGLYKSLQAWKEPQSCTSSTRMPSKQKKQWILKDQKRRKKLRKLLKRPSATTTRAHARPHLLHHDNHHWQTAPFWTSTNVLSGFWLINAVSTLDRNALNSLHQQLMELRSCKGHKQCNPEKGESLLDPSEPETPRQYFQTSRHHRPPPPETRRPLRDSSTPPGPLPPQTIQKSRPPPPRPSKTLRLPITVDPESPYASRPPDPAETSRHPCDPQTLRLPNTARP